MVDYAFFASAQALHWDSRFDVVYEREKHRQAVDKQWWTASKIQRT